MWYFGKTVKIKQMEYIPFHNIVRYFLLAASAYK